MIKKKHQGNPFRLILNPVLNILMKNTSYNNFLIVSISGVS